MAPRRWFSEKYPEFQRRAERELNRFSSRLDPRYEKIGINTPSTVSAKKRSSFDPEGFVKVRQSADLPRYDIEEIQANRIRSELDRLSRDRQIYAEWRRAEDRRRFNPSGRNAWPSNLYGASAQVFTNARSSPAVRFALNALPCVDRLTRREVLFAKKKAGRGYRKPKRRSWRSLIPC